MRWYWVPLTWNSGKYHLQLEPCLVQPLLHIVVVKKNKHMKLKFATHLREAPETLYKYRYWSDSPRWFVPNLCNCIPGFCVCVSKNPTDRKYEGGRERERAVISFYIMPTLQMDSEAVQESTVQIISIFTLPFGPFVQAINFDPCTDPKIYSPTTSKVQSGFGGIIPGKKSCVYCIYIYTYVCICIYIYLILHEWKISFWS